MRARPEEPAGLKALAAFDTALSLGAPVPALAKGKTDTGRIWVHARDDRPLPAIPAGGRSPMLKAARL